MDHHALRGGPRGKSLWISVCQEACHTQEQVDKHAPGGRPQGKSRWTIMDTSLSRARPRKREEREVKDISHVSDVDALVGRDAALDKTAAGAKADPLEHVLLSTHATANALSSGGA